MPNLNETRLKSQDVRIENGESIGIALPRDHPIRPSSPPIPIHEERVVGVAEQEFGLDALDEDGLDGFFALDKIERCIGLVEKRLRL